MKKLIEFVRGMSGKQWILAAVCVALILISLFVLFGKAGSAINESRINKLEAAKQQALKERDEARARDLILQGQIVAKDEQIKDLTSQIEQSNERVTNAHNETQSARANYSKVRSSRPVFNSADDAGRVAELGSELQRLYSDTP